MPTPRRTYLPYQRATLLLGPALFAVLLLLPTPQGMTTEGHRAAAVAALMILWWITEASPLPATALLPIALFPLLGVLHAKEVTLAYADANIFLFAGGFFIAMAMQKWNLHQRIAFNIVARTSTSLPRLILGFMIATAFLSMWISNTSTTLMMLPIGIAVIDHVKKEHSKKIAQDFGIALLLAIAYAASIGGVGTLIGTPPNIVFAAQFNTLFPGAPEIGFLQWMLVGIPIVIILLPRTWLLLTKFLYRLETATAKSATAEIQRRLDSLGKMSRGERIVLTVATTTALCWIFRADINIGPVTIPGWSNLFPNPALIHDSTVAIFFACLLFVLPVDLKRGDFALDWEWAQRIPWGILILFGGGLALAKAFKYTGLVKWLGDHLTLLENLPTLFVILAIALLITFLTEMTSNTATTAIMMPILDGAAAISIGANPLLLMIPATISASCAFMLPVATPPNAIIFGATQFSIIHMVRAGILLNLLGVLLVTLITYLIAAPVFDISFTDLPPWMNTQ